MSDRWSQLPLSDQTSWGSWMAPLLACITATEGPILEIGAGDWSTPFLHHIAITAGRPVHTVEADQKWMQRYRQLEMENRHTLQHAREGYELACHMAAAAATLHGLWGVVLVDGSPSETRAAQCLILRKHATYLVVHDFSGKECIEAFTDEVLHRWPFIGVAPRPRYSPSSLILGWQPIPAFPGVERL